jgi:hypothetical protein
VKIGVGQQFTELADQAVSFLPILCPEALADFAAFTAPFLFQRVTEGNAVALPPLATIFSSCILCIHTLFQSIPQFRFVVKFFWNTLPYRPNGLGIAACDSNLTAPRRWVAGWYVRREKQFLLSVGDRRLKGKPPGSAKGAKKVTTDEH